MTEENKNNISNGTNNDVKISFDSNVIKRSYMEEPNNDDKVFVVDDDDDDDIETNNVEKNTEIRYVDTMETLNTSTGSTNGSPGISNSTVGRVGRGTGGSGTTFLDGTGIQSSIRSTPTPTITSKDIIKLFMADNTEIEVSEEEVQRVRTMHRNFEEMAYTSFNYNTMIFVAAILAGLGLVSNSVATIIASMLVSPLMGPVIGIAYGSTVGDWQLVKVSLFNEILSLCFCIVMGMIIGSITGPTVLSNDWPTTEMFNRGTYANLIVGCPVAFFSGIGVAVSLLDDQASSLVGVAISASLLPPAVNCGILWVAYLFVQFDTNNTTNLGDSTYHNVAEYLEGGIVSLSLTIANIVLIIISSMICFRLKEILPIKKKAFWSDLGLARKIYAKKASIRQYTTSGTNYTTVQVSNQ